MSRTTLRQRLQLLAVGLAVGLLVVSIVGPLAIRERDASAADLRSRIEPMRTALSALQLAMIDQESAVRGFVLTGDRESLEPYFDGRRAAESQLLRLEALSEDDALVNARVNSVRAAVEQWQTEVAGHEIRLVENGQTGEAVAFERGGLGREASEEVREELRWLRQAMLRESARADERVLEARGRLSALVWALLVSGGALVMLSGVLLRRWITVPLSAISAAVEAVTHGDRHHRIPSLGPPDIACLAANVEEMRAETVRNLDESVRARQALEQQGPAVLTLRSELAPRQTRLPASLAFGAAFEPAEGDLAGDWYDLVDLGDGRVTLLLIDVSGHGPDAGVFALRAKHLLHAVMVDRPDPGEAFAWLAERIGDTGERFLTGLIAEVDSGTGKVRYANAGHPPGFLVSGAGGALERLDATGPLLGPLPGHWHTAEFQMPPGGQLVAYTDGLIEARGSTGREFGEDRLSGVLVGGRREPSALAAACVDRVRAFSAGHIEDDVTVAVLAFEPARARAGV